MGEEKDEEEWVADSDCCLLITGRPSGVARGDEGVLKGVCKGSLHFGAMGRKMELYGTECLEWL